MINLSEKYPNYFNKKILRSTFLICLIFIVFLFCTNGFKFTNVYTKCLDKNGCMNPFYICDDGLMFCQKSSICKSRPEFCEDEILKYNQEIGKYNFFYQNNNSINLVIILYGFLINHMYYMRKYGRKDNN